MAWEVEYTDEFETWWYGLDADEQKSIAASVGLLEVLGPQLPFPHSSGVKLSRYRRMRELRVQHKGKPYRIFYAFDPRRTAVLLTGRNKQGDDRFYERMVVLADRLYETHLEILKAEGFTDE